MEELLYHLVGDYILQTEQMAVRKLHSWVWALVHAAAYAVPFLLVVRTWECGVVIAGTHAVIDRLALAARLCRLRNLIWFGPGAPPRETVSGFGIDTPPYVRFWLVVIVDNTLHLTINHLALRYLNL